MKLLTKLTTLARMLVSGRQALADTPTSPEQPTLPSQPPVQTQAKQVPSDALEQTRVADLLRDQLGANREKGE